MATKKPNPDVSVYDYMNSKGKNGSYATRKAMFNDYFGGTYTGTAQQNLKLLADLKAGKVSLDKAPSIKTSNTTENKTTNTAKTTTTIPKGTKVVTVDNKKIVTPSVDKKVVTINSNFNKEINSEYERLSKYSNGKKIDLSNGKISTWKSNGDDLVLTSTELQKRYDSGGAFIVPKDKNKEPYYQEPNIRALNPTMSDVIYKDNKNNLDLLKKSINKKSKIKKIKAVNKK